MPLHTCLVAPLGIFSWGEAVRSNRHSLTCKVVFMFLHPRGCTRFIAATIFHHLEHILCINAVQGMNFISL